MVTNTKIPININIDKSKIFQQKLNTQEDKKLKQACDDFEAFFMQQFLDISLKNSKLAGESAGSDIIKGLYTEALSKASAGSVGISDMLYQFLTKNK